MHHGSVGKQSQGSIAMPGVIGSSNTNRESYTLGQMAPPEQVQTHSSLSYGGQPMVSMVFKVFLFKI